MRYIVWALLLAGCGESRTFQALTRTECGTTCDSRGSLVERYEDPYFYTWYSYIPAGRIKVGNTYIQQHIPIPHTERTTLCVCTEVDP